MPAGDRTGPMGAGPMTGRGMGICAGYGVPGYMNSGFGRGFGGGRGRGFGMGGGGYGWRHRYYATGRPGWVRDYSYHRYPVNPDYEAESLLNADDEIVYLKQESKRFERILKDVNKRLDELQSKEKEED